MRATLPQSGYVNRPFYSHADRGLLETPDAESPILQGITTAIIGQDGFSQRPLSKYFENVKATPVALTLASFVGHGTLRSAMMGEHYKSAATPVEVEKTRALVEQEMRAGALGLSSDLEYDPGLYSTVDEVIACGKVDTAHNGLYISSAAQLTPGSILAL